MPEAQDPILIRHLTPRNFLSFGPDHNGIELRALNVLIGPNGCGKSNLIEAVSFMRAAATDFQEVTRKGGGVNEWIWKGNPKEPASVEWVVKNQASRSMPLRHFVRFRPIAQSLSLSEERIEDERLRPGLKDLPFYYTLVDGQVMLLSMGRELPQKSVDVSRSILSQRRDPEAYPEISWLTDTYKSIRIYREWAFGRNTVFREPQKADMRRNVLEEDFSNLGLFLNRLKTEFPAAKRAILNALQDLYDGISDFEVNASGGTVQVFLHEGDFSIPATRLSDGTLRYLCLLTILCDPEPPPLICIEEPELGLHPDILPNLADLLIAASKRTQLIVTTHSEMLVDAMTETPENVVVCEKHEGKTSLNRLSSADLSSWLDKYRLGQMWIEGHLGGKRW